MLNKEEKFVTNKVFQSKIENCDNSALLIIISSGYSYLFWNLQELKNFISYLINNKSEILVINLLKDINLAINEFRDNKGD